jgi:hypothetical protein
MAECILCKSLIGKNNKPEHILLNALGGRKTVTNVICDSCNVTLGSGPDNHLANSVAKIRALAGFRAGDGDAPPKLRGLGPPNMHYDLVDGMPTANPRKPIQTKREPDGWTTIKIEARDRAHFEEMLDAAFRKEGITTDRVAQLRQKIPETFEIRHIPLPIDEINLSLGDRPSLRSMAKAILVLWATRVGQEEIHHPRYDAVRAFIVDDHESISIDINSKRLPPQISQFGLTPNMIWVGADNNGTVRGYFNLYGILGWTFEIGQGSPIVNSGTALISDPSNPRTRDDGSRIFESLPMDWVRAPRFQNEDLTEGFKNIHETIRLHNFDRFVERSIKDELSKHSISSGNFTEEQLHNFYKGLSHRIALGIFSIPWTEPLSSLSETAGGNTKKLD